MFDPAVFSADFELVGDQPQPEPDILLPPLSAIVTTLSDLSGKGQVAAKAILTAGDVEQALAERLERGSVVAHTVVGRSR